MNNRAIIVHNYMVLYLVVWVFTVKFWFHIVVVVEQETS